MVTPEYVKFNDTLAITLQSFPDSNNNGLLRDLFVFTDVPYIAYAVSKDMVQDAFEFVVEDTLKFEGDDE